MTCKLYPLSGLCSIPGEGQFGLCDVRQRNARYSRYEEGGRGRFREGCCLLSVDHTVEKGLGYGCAFGMRGQGRGGRWEVGIGGQTGEKVRRKVME